MDNSGNKNVHTQRGLVDPHGRHIEYVRLSVTDRCNLRCFYCLPKGFKEFEEPDQWLTFDEIERVMAAFGELGVERIRLTGGEPLVRKGLPELAGRLATPLVSEQVGDSVDPEDMQSERIREDDPSNS